MIQTITRKETTAASQPFTSAAKQLDFPALGYVEEEYSFSGTANVYGRVSADEMTVLVQDAPYTNRFLVRRPADPTKASGRVVLEILNTSSLFDIDRGWVLLHRSLLRNGDTYIGITSKPVTMTTLRKYDPARYAELSWNNPRHCVLPVRALGNFAGMSGPDTEDGLFWDMLTDLALEARQEPVWLGGVPVKQLYLIGWSQSGSDMIVYSNWFVRERVSHGLKNPFDGYLCCAPGPAVCPGLNQEESNMRGADTALQFSDVPFIQMHTESENANLGTHVSRRGNTDAPTRRYRVYDIAGATHDSYETMQRYYKDHSEMERIGLYLTYPGAEPNSNDFAYWMAFQAAYRCLWQWSEESILPPVTESIPVCDDLSNEKDANGNAVGGWRLPEIELPVCVYQQFCTPLVPGGYAFLYGAEKPYSRTDLLKRYGSLENYRKLAEQAADAAVANRLLDPADRDECVCHTVAKAKKYGLEEGTL